MEFKGTLKLADPHIQKGAVCFHILFVSVFFASPCAECAYECRTTSWTNDRVDLKVFITLKLTVSSQVLTLFGRWQGSTIFLESK